MSTNKKPFRKTLAIFMAELFSSMAFVLLLIPIFTLMFLANLLPKALMENLGYGGGIDG